VATTTVITAVGDPNAGEDNRDAEFPECRFYHEDVQLFKRDDRFILEDEVKELIKPFKRGAVEYGCVHIMHIYGKLTIDISNECDLHLAHPWLLEGALRGSYYCIVKLIEEVYAKSPNMAGVLMAYWSKNNG
jgi:hypothetical protein